MAGEQDVQMPGVTDAQDEKWTEIKVAGGRERGKSVGWMERRVQSRPSLTGPGKQTGFYSEGLRYLLALFCCGL